SRRQLLGTLTHPDVPQEPAQVRRLAVAAREGRHGESGDERSAVARSYAHGPFTVAPDVRVVHAPAEHPEIGLVDEQRERLADEKAARDSEQVGRGAIGLQDDPGPVGHDESVRAVVENLTRRGKLQLDTARLAPGGVALGPAAVGLHGEAREGLLELPALDAQLFQ